MSVDQRGTGNCEPLWEAWLNSLRIRSAFVFYLGDQHRGRQAARILACSATLGLGGAWLEPNGCDRQRYRVASHVT